MDRREYIISVASLSAIAGCTSDSEDTENTSTDNTTETTEEPYSPETENETETETETPTPADLSVNDLSVSSSTVSAGESVQVSVEVVNEGEESGTRTIGLIVDDEEVSSKEVEVEVGQSSTLEFEVEIDQPKTYSVSVGDLQTSFEAVAAEVGGVIDSDTTWTTAEGPYTIVQTVQVAEGATLTIEPGVTIWASEENSQDSLFVLHGDIIANGSSSNKITIDGSADPRSTVFNADGSSPEAFLDAEYCLIRNAGPFWERGHGGFNLRRSELRDVDSSYIWYPYKDTSYREDISRSEVNIEYNKFINSGGFSIGHDSRTLNKTVTVNIRHNVFKGGEEAVYGGLINNWTSYGESETVVEYNSFLEMTDQVVLKLPSGYESAAMTAPNNYWGTTDESTIKRMIYHKNDDINSAGEIEFKPILDEPHPDTPTIS
jgi:hypothetical protein